MAIQVTCPGCLARFSVGDQFAGKKGPCPKCKEVITIPSAEEAVVIHAPTPEGPTDSKGRSVLKTVKRKDTAFDPLVATGVGGVVLLTLLAAFLLRGQEVANGWPVLAGGAVLLGPLVAWSGYAFLRDQELEPHRGANLWLRSAICGVVFALGWGVYVLIASQLGETDWRVVGLLTWQMGFAGVVAIGVGALGAFASLDLEPVMATLNCALYFVITIALRAIMALDALPGLVFEDF